VATIVISSCNVVKFPDRGGHFWVYMQYALGLRQLGCEVYWLEDYRGESDPDRDGFALSTFFNRMERYGLGGKVILYRSCKHKRDKTGAYKYLNVTQSEAEAVFRRADLLLNFYYAIDIALLSLFRRTALVDIDPGSLQFWISRGQMFVHPHDYYFTTGETVGTAAALFPDCGLPWLHIRPLVCLELWPYAYDPSAEAFTAVSSWDGGEWIVDGEETHENNKRVTFLQFAELPGMTPQVLELALFLETAADTEDRRAMESHGWRIRHCLEVAATPEMYQSYIQRSRGEFGCVKPSCTKFQNAWVSDRSLCYLASGKPVVVQNTGPSSFLPNGEGMFRFSTLSEAADALATINSDYERHCRAAREIAEIYFDAKQVSGRILNYALH
jgi:hypothetical protein